MNKADNDSLTDDEDVIVDVDDNNAIEQYPTIEVDYGESTEEATNCSNAKETAGLTKLETNYQQVEKRLAQGCHCLNNCLEGLKAEAVFKHRLNIAELAKNEHDMYLMGVTVSCLGNRQETNRHKERQKQHPNYSYQGRRVCLEAFSYLENVTQYHLKQIRMHVLRHGVSTRTHGNLGKKPHNAFSLDMYKAVVAFVKSFISRHSGMSGNIHGTIVIHGESVTSCYRAYKQQYAGTTANFLGYSTFRDFLVKQFPNLKLVKAKEAKAKEVMTPKKKTTTALVPTPAASQGSVTYRLVKLPNAVVPKT
jgi:hypothetical protein